MRGDLATMDEDLPLKVAGRPPSHPDERQLRFECMVECMVVQDRAAIVTALRSRPQPKKSETALHSMRIRIAANLTRTKRLAACDKQSSQTQISVRRMARTDHLCDSTT